jgi:hypothetical protein
MSINTTAASPAESLQDFEIILTGITILISGFQVYVVKLCKPGARQLNLKKIAKGAQIMN